MTNNMPCYSISSEEFVQDYLTLPDSQKLILFKLRMGYSMKGSSLIWDDILGLCPVSSDEEENDRQKVLKRFFRNEGNLWIDDRIELSLKQKFDQEVYKRQQAMNGRLGAKKRWSKDNDHGNPNGDPNGNPNGDPNGNPNGNPNGDPNGNPNGDPNGNPNGNPNGDPNGNPNGDPNGNPNGNPNGDPNGNPNGDPNGNPNGNPNGDPNGNPNGDPNGNPNGDPNGLPTNPLNDQQIGYNDAKSAFAASHTHAHTRASDSDFNYLYINKNNKSDSDVHAHTHAREDEPDLKINQEKIKKIFDEKVNADWSFDEAFELLKQAGLNGQMLHQWLNRKSQNYFKFMQISKSMNLFDAHRFIEVIERCKTAKIKEKREFSTAIAFVVKALEKELESMQTQTSPPRQQPQKFSERDYWKGVVRLPDGSLRVAPKELRK